MHLKITPDQKAKELVKKFSPFVYCYSGSDMLANQPSDSVILMFSKLCAETAVDELIKSYEGLDVDELIEYFKETEKEYWQKVKAEIANVTIDDITTVK